MFTLRPWKPSEKLREENLSGRLQSQTIKQLCFFFFFFKFMVVNLRNCITVLYFWEHFIKNGVFFSHSFVFLCQCKRMNAEQHNEYRGKKRKRVEECVKVRSVQVPSFASVVLHASSFLFTSWFKEFLVSLKISPIVASCTEFRSLNHYYKNLHLIMFYSTYPGSL